jgi:DNA-binding GntR family transcriptional regulator
MGDLLSTIQPGCELRKAPRASSVAVQSGARAGRQNGSAADRVFAVLRRAIIEGRIAPGSKLSEPALAAEHAVSRAPLREAIGRLEALGLVERRARIGARVVELSDAGLIELYEIREPLEGTAARLAAERMSDTARAELAALIEHHGQEVEREHGQAYFQQEGDLDFHYRIVQGSGNGRLIRILCDDLYHLMRMYRCQFGMKSHRARDALKEHALVVEAIAARDGELAEWLMRRHVRASRLGVERQLAAKRSPVTRTPTIDPHEERP